MALEGVVSLDGAGSKVSAGGEVRREGGMVALALSSGFCFKFQGCYILTAGEKKGLGGCEVLPSSYWAQQRCCRWIL